jgi:hypothetical protein
LLRGLPGWGAFAGAMVVTEGMSIHTQKAELRKEDNTLLRGVMLDVVPMCLCVLYVSWSIPFRIAFLQHFTFGARAAPKASARARAPAAPRARERPPPSARRPLRARAARELGEGCQLHHALHPAPVSQTGSTRSGGFSITRRTYIS